MSFWEVLFIGGVSGGVSGLIVGLWNWNVRRMARERIHIDIKFRALSEEDPEKLKEVVSEFYRTGRWAL